MVRHPASAHAGRGGVHRARRGGAGPPVPRPVAAGGAAGGRPAGPAHLAGEAGPAAPVAGGDPAAGHPVPQERHRGAARRRLVQRPERRLEPEAGERDRVPAGRRPGQHVGPGAGEEGRLGRRRRGARLPRDRPDALGAAGLGAGGRPAARPAGGPQRGGLLRGPAADRRHGHRLRQGTPGRRPVLPEDRAGAEALPGLQQRGGPEPHLFQPDAPAQARVLRAAVPGGHLGRRRDRGHGLVQPGERAAQPRQRRPGRGRQVVDGQDALQRQRRLGAARAHRPGAVLRRQGRGVRRGAQVRTGQLHRRRQRRRPDAAAPHRRPGPRPDHRGRRGPEREPGADHPVPPGPLRPGRGTVQEHRPGRDRQRRAPRAQPRDRRQGGGAAEELRHAPTEVAEVGRRGRPAGRQALQRLVRGQDAVPGHPAGRDQGAGRRRDHQ